MGVDYYSQEYYRFHYKNPEKGNIEFFSEEAGPRDGGYAYYDPDLQTFSDYLEDIEKMYGAKRLFENGHWFCTSDCKARLQDILEKNKDKEVVAIFKVLCVWARA